ncbi:MAG: AAA family ATPase [Nostoc sp.]|uniref:AAA family ATPase n=1 Tax=Nostoc sp. TaxID=1180 RepID=UPI002FF717EA
MTSPQLPPNAYTNAPQQHPNLILGSLQLLFWLVFRPSAWRNHLKRIDPILDTNSSLIILLRQGRWPNLALRRLLIQGYFILPILANLLLGLVLWALGKPIANIAFHMTCSVVGSVVGGLVFGVMGGMAFGLVFGLGVGVAAGLAVDLAVSLAGDMAISVMRGIVVGVTFGLAVGLAVGVAGNVTKDVEFGLAIGFPIGTLFGIAGGVTQAGGLAFSLAIRLTEGVAQDTVGSATVGVALGIVVAGLFSAAGVKVAGLAFGLGASVGITINSWRPVVSSPFLTVWNYLLYKLEKRRNGISPCLLRYNSAFWDEFQPSNLRDLNKHLLFVIEYNPVEGQAALEYLSGSTQFLVLQTTQIELEVRRLESCADVEAIASVHRSLANSELESPISNLLNIFSRISKDVDAALNQETTYNKRKILSAVAERLNAESQALKRSSHKYASRFYPISQSWLNIVSNKIDKLVKATELRQEIDNPYIIGVPLNEQLELFTGRTSIGIRIEQLLLDHRRPPLLLYGQRRMGKTSLLNNIGKLLPNSIIPMFVDLQGAPSSASDHAGFLYNLARDMEKSAKKQGLTLPSLTREVLQSDSFTYFYEWLDKVEQALEQNTALLALDEFEVLDNAIAKGRFDEQDVLGMLRHLIQHRPRFKVLLAGSHTIEEYQRWASYLINVQVVHISYLKEAEARQLIEHPVKDFTLRYEINAVERVLQLTRCHPFLVQLLCAEIVVLKNEQDPSIRRLAILADVEAAIPAALQSGGFFFADIQNNQVDATGQTILRFIAAQGEGAIVSRQTLLQQFPDADITFNLLLQRELIEEVDDGYGFQVELIRRWFI